MKTKGKADDRKEDEAVNYYISGSLLNFLCIWKSGLMFLESGTRFETLYCYLQ